MGTVQSKKSVLESTKKQQDNNSTKFRIPDSYLEKLSVTDMITEFLKLVRGGQFVNALYIILGHGRFHWYFTLVEKVSKRLFCERETSESLEILDMSIGSESKRRLYATLI